MYQSNGVLNAGAATNELVLGCLRGINKIVLHSI
jgi:hypothetical protein